MMSLHTARLITEKLTSHQPADVHFSGVSKGIDMGKDYFEFIVGDCGSVRGLASGNLELTFLAGHATIDGEDVLKLVEESALVEISDISPESAYLLGRALLMAAKMKGISE